MKIKELHLIQKKDIEKAVAVLTRAFHEDPLIRLIYPDSEERKRYTPILWKFLTKDGLKYGEVYSPTKEIEGVAKWLPPGREHMGIWRTIRSGGLKMGVALTRQNDERKLSPRRIEEITNKITQIHKGLMKEPHWYLANIGVDTEFQGKGYGSKLIKPMLERIEKTGYPVFLETNFEGNVGLYEHLGFDLIDETKIPETEIVNWAMIKKP
ncbi:MAG: GNAT family N-acetyltransferase [Candidatus Heimdallarchaeota archaeon]|nr:GNAT family N-acetyltransferase [Candidatus Heimdallarchaeota archaeon]MCK5408938.1 GNAT family N-acetyltransferase [Candidatus Heimdallarchaeota archaeon]